MTKIEITGILDEIKKTMERNIVIIDFSNLIHWQNTLKWLFFLVMVIWLMLLNI